MSINGVPVSIPDNAQSYQDCFLGVPTAPSEIEWIPFGQGLNHFYGGTGGQYRCGNAHLSVTFGGNNRWALLEREAFLQNITAVVEKVKALKHKQEQEAAQQKAVQAAQIKEKQNQQLIKTFEKTTTQTIIKNQIDALESAYCYWSSPELQKRYATRAEALKKDLSENNSSCTMLQKTLEQEAEDLLQQSAQLTGKEAVFYQDHINQTAHLAQEVNEQGHVLFSSQLLDWGWTILNYTKAAVMGCKDGVENTLNSCLHPLETVCDMAKGIVKIAQLSVQALQEGTALVQDAFINTEEAQKRLNRYQKKLNRVYQEFKEIPTEQLIRKTTAFLTEAVLVHKALSALPKIKELAKSSSKKAVQCIEQIKKAEQAQVAGTHISVPFNSLFEQMAPEIEASTARIGRKSKSIALGKAEKFITFNQEVELLKQRFDNVICGGELFNYNKITFNFEHIFEGYPIVGQNGKLIKLNGFHHDLLGAIEKAGRIQGTPLEILAKQNGIAGTYELTLKGKWDAPKTFFPQNWTREQVMKKIIEAYKYAKNKSECIFEETAEKLILKGKTKENIQIKLAFNKRGKLITAFPEIT